MAANQNPKPVAVLPKQPSAFKLNSVASPKAEAKPETAAPLNPGQGVLKSTGGVGIKTGAATPSSPKQAEKGPVTIHRTETGTGAPAKTAGATTAAKPTTNGTAAHGAAHVGDNPAKKPAGTTTPAAGATSPKVVAGGEHKAAAGGTGVNATPKTTAPKTEAAKTESKAPAKTATGAATGTNATGNTAGSAGTVAAKKTTTEQPKTAAVAKPAGTEAPKAGDGKTAAATTSTVAAKKTVASTTTPAGTTTTAKKVEAPKATATTTTAATDPAKKPVVAAKKLTPTPPSTDKPADKPPATEKTTAVPVHVEAKAAVTKDDNSSNGLDTKHADSPKATDDGPNASTNGTSDESAGRVYVQPVTLPAELLPGADDPSLPPPPGENGAEPASPKGAEPKKATPQPTGFRKPEDSRGNLKAIKAQHDERAATNPTPIKTEIVIHPLDVSRNDARRGTVAPPPPDELPPPLDNDMPPPPPDEMPPPPEDPVPVVVPKEVAKPEKIHHDKPEKATVKTLGSSSRNLVTETKTETKESKEKDHSLEISTKTHVPKELAGTESTLEDDTKIPIAPLGPDGQPLDNLDGFELGLALKALANDNVQLVRQLEEDDSQMATLRASVVHSSRRNFILERELNEIDEKIKLLIKNRITVQEIVAQQQGLQNLNNVDEAGDSLKGKLSLYEDLFYLLQTKPAYFARLARLLTAKNIPPFVQTVVFDLYGDQYETREERLLLALFKLVLQAELEHCTDQGSLLRANTAITQMLSAYARRGQGLSVLKDILEQPLKSLTARKDLNLEINPSKIYAQLITDYETKTGKQSPLPRAVPDEVAAANTEVQAIVAERSKELQKLADYILTRIMDGVESIPYGVRWTCKQLGELSKKRFPDSDRYQIGSLIGGYIYLRFFNPVIATPDSVNFISVKPSKNMRRNLVLIAKVLQNLSNGILFGDKEQYMKPLNKFIQERMDPLQDYFDRLISVDDLEDSVAVDKLMEHTQRQMPVIQISLNQIFLLHSLCEKHAKVVAPDEKDPLHNLLKQLGQAPPQIADKAQNRTVALQLTDRRQQRIGTAVTDGFASPKVNPLYIKAKQSLLELLKKLPTSTDCTSIMEFLEDQKDKSNPQMAGQIDGTISMLRSLVSSNLMTKGKTLDETYNMFLWAFAQEAATRRKRISQLAKKMTLVKAALKSIETHFGYLQSRLELYKVYLDNARKGQAGGDAVAEKKLAAAKGPAKVLAKKFTHPELAEQGVLTKVLIDAPNAILKKCYYVFTMDSPGKFKVEVHVKQGVDIKLLNKPIELVLEDLLQKQERHEREIEVDAVQLNVNLLIHLLNTHFVTKA